MIIEDINEKLLFSYPEKKTDVGILFGAKSVSGEIARAAANLYHRGAFESIVLTGGQKVREVGVLLALSANFTGLAKPKLNFTQLEDFTSSQSEADYMEKVLLDNDVPSSAITFKDDKSKNTGENVANISAHLTEFNSLGVITTAYFQRRAMGTIRHDKTLADKTLASHAVYPFGFTQQNWHQTLIKNLVSLESQRMDKDSPKTYVGIHCVDPDINAEINKASSLPDLKI